MSAVRLHRLFQFGSVVVSRRVSFRSYSIMTSGFTDMDSLITISVTDASRIFVEMVTQDEGVRILSSARHALQMAEVSHEPPT